MSPRTIAGALDELHAAARPIAERLDRRADPLVDCLDALLDRLVELRTRPRLVLWGGKPGRDVQFGSRLDQRRQARLNGNVSVLVRLTMEDVFTPAVRALGISMREAHEQLRKSLASVSSLNTAAATPPVQRRLPSQVDKDLATLRRLLAPRR